VFRPLKCKRAAVVVGSVAALALAASAFAFFTTTGTGIGTASVGSATAFTVSFGTATGGPLFPGSGIQRLPYTIANPGGGAEQLTTTTATVASSSGNVTSTGTPVPGCLAAWFTAANTAPATASLDPGASTTGSVAVTMQDSGTSQNLCQGVTPDITVDAG
jgi:VCBS repeat-containing protein